MVDHIIYKTVKYVGILYPVLNQEPQQHINLPRLWGNHSLVSYEASQLSQSPYDCFCNKYHFSPPFLRLPKEIISGKCLRKKKWSLQEIVLKLKPSRKLVQKHYRQNLEYYLKCYCEITVLLKMIEVRCSFKPLTFLNTCWSEAQCKGEVTVGQLFLWDGSCLNDMFRFLVPYLLLTLKAASHCFPPEALIWKF